LVCMRSITIAVEGDMVKVCCVCRKFEQKGQWKNTIAITCKKVSHVYCPLCFNDLMGEIDRYAMQKWSKSVYTVIETSEPLAS
jgi:hypothetical protein